MGNSLLGRVYDGNLAASYHQMDKRLAVGDVSKTDRVTGSFRLQNPSILETMT
jgi:hypothetical protein